VGCLGLIRGLQRWDYSRGYRVSTFVSWHIRQSIQRWRANDVLLIRIPVHVWDDMATDAPGLSAEAERAVARAQNVLSLEAMQDRNEDFAWDGGMGTLEEQLDLVRLAKAMDTELTERERGIIQLRFGIGSADGEPMVLDEIGARLGVTRERVRQIEKKAIGKMRNHALKGGHPIAADGQVPSDEFAVGSALQGHNAPGTMVSKQERIASLKRIIRRADGLPVSVNAPTQSNDDDKAATKYDVPPTSGGRDRSIESK
jgi:RNA polymerase sigma factor (sigma-70 family)